METIGFDGTTAVPVNFKRPLDPEPLELLKRIKLPKARVENLQIMSSGMVELDDLDISKAIFTGQEVTNFVGKKDPVKKRQSAKQLSQSKSGNENRFESGNETQSESKMEYVANETQSESGNANQSESENENQSESGNENQSESGNANQSESGNANQSESGNENQSKKPTENQSESGNANQSKKPTKNQSKKHFEHSETHAIKQFPFKLFNVLQKLPPVEKSSSIPIVPHVCEKDFWKFSAYPIRTNPPLMTVSPRYQHSAVTLDKFFAANYPIKRNTEVETLGCFYENSKLLHIYKFTVKKFEKNCEQFLDQCYYEVRPGTTDADVLHFYNAFEFCAPTLRPYPALVINEQVLEDMDSALVPRYFVEQLTPIVTPPLDPSILETSIDPLLFKPIFPNGSRAVAIPKKILYTNQQAWGKIHTHQTIQLAIPTHDLEMKRERLKVVAAPILVRLPYYIDFDMNRICSLDRENILVKNYYTFYFYEMWEKLQLDVPTILPTLLMGVPIHQAFGYIFNAAPSTTLGKLYEFLPGTPTLIIEWLLWFFAKHGMRMTVEAHRVISYYYLRSKFTVSKNGGFFYPLFKHFKIVPLLGAMRDIQKACSREKFSTTRLNGGILALFCAVNFTDPMRIYDHAFKFFNENVFRKSPAQKNGITLFNGTFITSMLTNSYVGALQQFLDSKTNDVYNSQPVANGFIGLACNMDQLWANSLKALQSKTLFNTDTQTLELATPSSGLCFQIQDDSSLYGKILPSLFNFKLLTKIIEQIPKFYNWMDEQSRLTVLLYNPVTRLHSAPQGFYPQEIKIGSTSSAKYRLREVTEQTPYYVPTHLTPKILQNLVENMSHERVFELMGTKIPHGKTYICMGVYFCKILNSLALCYGPKIIGKMFLLKLQGVYETDSLNFFNSWRPCGEFEEEPEEYEQQQGTSTETIYSNLLANLNLCVERETISENTDLKLYEEWMAKDSTGTVKPISKVTEFFRFRDNTPIARADLLKKIASVKRLQKNETSQAYLASVPANELKICFYLFLALLKQEFEEEPKWGSTFLDFLRRNRLQILRAMQKKIAFKPFVCSGMMSLGKSFQNWIGARYNFDFGKLIYQTGMTSNQILQCLCVAGMYLWQFAAKDEENFEFLLSLIHGIGVPGGYWKKAFMFVGSSNSSKSYFFNILADIFKTGTGGYFNNFNDFKNMVHLYGSNFLVISEELHFIPGDIIKQIANFAPLSTRIIFTQSQLEVPIAAKPIFLVNKIPKISDVDSGVTTRLICYQVVHRYENPSLSGSFSDTFTPTEFGLQNLNLTYMRNQGEEAKQFIQDGFCLFDLMGGMKFHRKEVYVSKDIYNTTLKITTHVDSVANFLTKVIIYSSKSIINNDKIIAMYKEFCKRNGIKEEDSQVLKMRLKELWPEHLVPGTTDSFHVSLTWKNY